MNKSILFNLLAVFLCLIVAPFELSCFGQKLEQATQETEQKGKEQEKDEKKKKEKGKGDDKKEKEVDKKKRLADIKQVQSDVKQIHDAVYDSDVDTTVKFTHPKIVEMMGGKEKAKSQLSKLFKQLKDMELKVESFKFHKDPVFVETKSARYAIIPTKIVLEVNGQRFDCLNYQFGQQKKDEKRWFYLEGSRINNQTVRLLFPDFPKDYKFPEIYRKRL